MQKKVNQVNILEKFNISELKPMQKEALEIIPSSSDTIIISPTGSGKTLAFLLPLIQEIDPECKEVQILIIVPSRELAIQIEQVARDMGSGLKINAVYGGRSGVQDKIDLKHRPAILIGTPGRIADHLRRERFSDKFISTLVLDEFDKTLEVGFEAEMIEIVDALPNLKKRVLTSATRKLTIPAFIGLSNPVYINYQSEGVSQLKIETITSPSKDKLATLVKALGHLKNQPGIVFCNFKDSLHRVSDFLTENNINHGFFHGGMEQFERERNLIKFRNGTYQLLLATDLAARGIDIPEIKFIIHYHLPPNKKEFVHRNGRTARMNAEGTAYVLKWEDEKLPEFIEELNLQNFDLPDKENISNNTAQEWQTLFISGGRRDKISKGDIAGLFIKQGNLKREELGVIELKPDCAFVAVDKLKAETVIKALNNKKIKKKKVRISFA